ncbi:MAG: MBL fold metallo-hydrolase [Conexivisphaerales archaeon]
MKVTVLGAAGEVGRSAFTVESNGTRLLLDYGVQTNREPLFPVHIRPRDVKGVILSHAHLDHVGGAPLLYLGEGLPAYGTPVTKSLTELLLYDFLKISGDYLPFDAESVSNFSKNYVSKGYEEGFKIGSIDAVLFDAGHIPGSAITYLTGDRRLLYTGDMNTTKTQLLDGVRMPVLESDIVITESTYSYSDHPARKDEEVRFIEKAREIVESGGVFLVPSFAVGRAQEIACILYSYGFKGKVYMDGMALKTNSILLENRPYIRDYELLSKALSSVEYIQDWAKRKRVVKEPCVIISPAGMLVGGASIFYNSRIANDQKSAVAIVSFQVEGSPGRRLLEKREVTIDGKRYKKVKASIYRFDFSSHLGKSELLNFFKTKIKGSPKIIVVHGERRYSESFAGELKSELGFDASVPEMGESLVV